MGSNAAISQPAAAAPLVSKVLRRETIVRPAASDDWFATSVNEPVVSRDEVITACTDAARKNVPARLCRAKMTVRTSPHWRSEFCLRFASALPVDATISIGGNAVHTFAAVPAGGLTLFVTCTDITTWTEADRDVEITIDFDFGARDGEIHIFEKGSSCAPSVRRTATIGSMAQSVCFFSASVLLLIALALIAAGFLPRKDTAYRALGVVFVAAGSLYHLFGGPDLPALAPRRRMRRWFAATRAFRRATVVTLVIVAAATTSMAAGIAGTLYRRHVYTRAIDEARGGGNVRAPFLLFPWRREGQMLIECEAYRFRSRDNERLRQYLTRVVNDAVFRSAALSDRKVYRRDSRDDARVVADPAIWYVALLLESGQDDARKRALDILRNRQGDEAAIQRTLIELNLAKSDATRTDKLVATLEHLLDHRTNPNLKYSFLYQQAWDGIGAIAILRAGRRLSCGSKCTDDDRAAITADLDKARNAFQLVLDARAEALQGDDPRWLRPPDKLTVYHLVSPSPKNAAAVKRAQWFAGRYAECRCFLAGIATADCDQQQLQKALTTDELKTPSKWLAGTVLEAKALEGLTASVAEGWRY